MLPIIINVLLVIHVTVSLLIILLVLMQRPKNEGLGAAFGGGMTDNLFGAQTTNVLQTITRWLGGMFFILTLLLSILYVKQGGGRSPIQDKLSAKTVIPEPLPPAPTPGDPLTLPVPASDAVSPLDEKGLELGPDQPAGAFSESVKPALPAPDAGTTPEKTVPAAPPVPPAEKKADAPAPEPKPVKQP
jgi:preprotein translocase subunit SecG